MTNVVRQLRQVAGVESVKIVDFKKGIFAVTPQRGVRLSERDLLAAARRSGFQPDRVVPPGAAPAGESVGASQPRADAAGDTVLGQLAAAGQAFRRGQYQQALQLARQVAAKIGGEAAAGGEREVARRNARIGQLQQLLSLIYFALGQYDDAAAAAHAALHKTPPWDWKELRGHYATAADYTAQLRALEDSIRRQSTGAKRFLVGYHYLMLGQRRAARAQLARAAEASPNDKLIAKLLQDLQKKDSR